MDMKITVFALVCAIIIVVRDTLLEYLDAKNKYQKEKKYNFLTKHLVSFFHKKNHISKICEPGEEK